MKFFGLAVFAALGRPSIRCTSLIFRVAEPSSRTLIPLSFHAQKKRPMGAFLMHGGEGGNNSAAQFKRPTA